MNKFYQFLQLTKEANKQVDLGGIYDPIGMARKTLGLKEKYLPTDSGEGQTADGRKIKLLTVEEAKEKGLKHRLFIECPSCNQMIPGGRLLQHEPACFKKKSPSKLEDMKEFKQRVSDFNKDILRTTNIKDKEAKLSVLMDMLEEKKPDPRWLGELNFVKRNLENVRDEIAMKEELGDDAYILRGYSDQKNIAVIRSPIASNEYNTKKYEISRSDSGERIFTEINDFPRGFPTSGY